MTFRCERTPPAAGGSCSPICDFICPGATSPPTGLTQVTCRENLPSYTAHRAWIFRQTLILLVSMDGVRCGYVVLMVPTSSLPMDSRVPSKTSWSRLFHFRVFVMPCTDYWHASHLSLCRAQPLQDNQARRKNSCERGGVFLQKLLVQNFSLLTAESLVRLVCCGFQCSLCVK